MSSALSYKTVAEGIKSGGSFARMVGLTVCLAVVMAGGMASAQSTSDDTEYSLSGPASAEIGLLITTSLGEIVVRIDTTKAPVTSANFLAYVDGGLFDGGSFFRTVHMRNQPDDSLRIEVIQGGADQERRDEYYRPIKLERTSETGLVHADGTLSMARAGPNTATASFFICIGDQPELDFGGMRNPDGQGFAAFGQVTDGMQVVRAIQSAPADGQSIREPVVIVSIQRRR